MDARLKEAVAKLAACSLQDSISTATYTVSKPSSSPNQSPEADSESPGPSPPTSTPAASVAAPPATSRPVYHQQVLDAFLRSVGNEVVFLPNGLGTPAIADDAIRTMLHRHPSKHVVCVVVRPAQALSLAHRMRTELDVSTAAFCGGDFLYDFPTEFAANRVLVFTAGLLMRLTKLGTYRLDSASLLVLYDAFSAVRNHPMNTLVREYYWKSARADAAAASGAAANKSAESSPSTAGTAPSSSRPKILGIMHPQLQQNQHYQNHRPFDKLRQMVRKLCQSCRAGVLLPTGPALEALAARVHSSHLAIHGIVQTQLEQGVLEALQMHCLLIWDTLHQFGQNHFGRLVHIPPTSTNTTPVASAGGAHGNAMASALPLPLRMSLDSSGVRPRITSDDDNYASPVDHFTQGGGSATPSSTPSQFTPPGSVNGGASAATRKRPTADFAFASDPAHHDWGQIEVMLRHSIACTEALPSAASNTTDTTTSAEVENSPEDSTAAAAAGGAAAQDDHFRSEAALAVMRHVLACCHAMRIGLELGLGACLELMLPALSELQTFLTSPPCEAEAAAGYHVDAELRESLLVTVPASPLVAWLAACSSEELSEGIAAAPSRLTALTELLLQMQEHATERALNAPLPGTTTATTNEDGKEEDSNAKVSSDLRVAIIVGSETSAAVVQQALSTVEGLQKTTIHRWNPSASSSNDATTTTTTDASTKRNTEEGENDDDEAVEVSDVIGRPACHLDISLITSEEAATTTAGHDALRTFSEVVWFSASDVLHVAGFDMESRALSTLCRVCAAGDGTGSNAGPECHILGTDAQAAAYLEVCRADQLLLAASQLVQAGDAAFEEYLSQLAAGNGGADAAEQLSLPSPAAALHTLCLGLCGKPPRFKSATPSREGRRVTVELPDCMAQGVLAAVATAGDNVNNACLAACAAAAFDNARFTGDPASSESEARDAAAEAALSALVACGMVAAYWQTRQLVSVTNQLGLRSTRPPNQPQQQQQYTQQQHQQLVKAAEAATSSPKSGGAAGDGDGGYLNTPPRPRPQGIHMQQSPQPHPSPLGPSTGRTGLGIADLSPAEKLPPSPYIDGAVTSRTKETMHNSLAARERWGSPSAASASNAAASAAAGIGSGGTGGGGGGHERRICTVCGIVTTSEAHYREHLAGKKHQINCERLHQQDAASMAATTTSTNASTTDASTAPAPGTTADADTATLTQRDGAVSSLSEASSGTIVDPSIAPLMKQSTIDRLPSTLSDTFIRRSSSIGLHRLPSGNVYEGFPCVRVGDVILPSSMDLRAFLDEMQEAGELEPHLHPTSGGGGGGGLGLGPSPAASPSVAEALPPIQELSSLKTQYQHLAPPTASAVGVNATGSAFGSNAAQQQQGASRSGSSSASGSVSGRKTPKPHRRKPSLSRAGSYGSNTSSGGGGSGGLLTGGLVSAFQSPYLNHPYATGNTLDVSAYHALLAATGHNPAASYAAPAAHILQYVPVYIPTPVPAGGQQGAGTGGMQPHQQQQQYGGQQYNYHSYYDQQQRHHWAGADGASSAAAAAAASSAAMAAATASQAHFNAQRSRAAVPATTSTPPRSPVPPSPGATTSNAQVN